MGSKFSCCFRSNETKPKSPLLWDALSSRAECSDFCGASEGSDAFRALGTCSSFCLRLKDCENVNKQLCTLHAETDSTFGITSRRGFLKTHVRDFDKLPKLELEDPGSIACFLCLGLHILRVWGLGFLSGLGL